jgi:hypothetical protein
MRVHSSTRYLALAALVGALACAGNKAETDDGTQPEQAGAARDTTNGQADNPPGYRGMETDTTIAPTGQPSDTFLQNQGTGQAQDTAGYSGMERDTSAQQANPSGGQDTSGMTGIDTTGGQTDTTSGQTDTTGASSGAANLDSTGLSKTGDTTGYQQSQQSQDTTTSR